MTSTVSAPSCFSVSLSSFYCHMYFAIQRNSCATVADEGRVVQGLSHGVLLCLVEKCLEIPGKHVVLKGACVQISQGTFLH